MGETETTFAYASGSGHSISLRSGVLQIWTGWEMYAMDRQRSEAAGGGGAPSRKEGKDAARER